MSRTVVSALMLFVFWSVVGVVATVPDHPNRVYFASAAPLAR